MPVDHERILRYRKQSLQLLESAFNQMRSGRWSRSEDLLRWNGSGEWYREMISSQPPTMGVKGRIQIMAEQPSRNSK